jgi:hypothetical protein
MNIGCNPFSGRLTHSTRQMREHKTVSPNYCHLSTSTLFCVTKRFVLREMMLKLNDVCVCHEQLVELLGVCVLLSFRELKKKK